MDEEGELNLCRGCTELVISFASQFLIMELVQHHSIVFSSTSKEVGFG